MKTLYLDCFAGIAGDMLTAALFELVPDMDYFKAELRKMTRLSVEDYEVCFEKGVKNGITGTYFHVHTHEHHPHRGLKEIEDIVMSSTFSPRIQREVMRAFALLADAEAEVHGTTPDKIHFHEVGAIDSILDIVGTYVLIDRLGWPRVLASPVNVGSGTVECAHGILPVPAPATEKLLHGIPICSRGEPMERTTPTGALLVRCLADAFCDIPSGTIADSGYGLGTRDSDLPNVLRVLLMDEQQGNADGFEHDRAALLETNIDDMNPQDFELVLCRLFEKGAFDAWLESVFMKKGRPGTKLCCLCAPDKADELSFAILRGTTTQGVRKTIVDRAKLCYKIEEVSTSLGTVRVKATFMNGESFRRIPEYEDLKRVAEECGLSLIEVRNRVVCEI